MSPVRTAIALSIVCGLGAQYGWLNASCAAGVLALTYFLLRVAREAPRIFRANGGHLSEQKRRRLADYIVCVAAALSKKDSSRDLALEAISTLDDMAEDGHGVNRLIVAAVRLALRLPGSISARSSSKVPTPRAAGDQLGQTRAGKDVPIPLSDPETETVDEPDAVLDWETPLQGRRVSRIEEAVVRISSGWARSLDEAAVWAADFLSRTDDNQEGD